MCVMNHVGYLDPVDILLFGVSGDTVRNGMGHGMELEEKLIRFFWV